MQGWAEGEAELWFNTNEGLNQSVGNFGIGLALQTCFQLGEGIQTFQHDFEWGSFLEFSLSLKIKAKKKIYGERNK